MRKKTRHSSEPQFQLLRELAFSAFPPWSTDAPSRMKELSNLLKRNSWLKHLSKCTTNTVEKAGLIHLLRNSHKWRILRVVEELKALYDQVVPSTWIQIRFPDEIIAAVVAEM